MSTLSSLQLQRLFLNAVPASEYNDNNDNDYNTLCMINFFNGGYPTASCYVAADMLLAVYDARGVVNGLSGRLCPWLLSWSLVLLFFGFSPLMESLFNTSSR